MGAKTKEELHSRGYQDARNVPRRYLNETQRWIQRVSKSGKPSLDVGTAQKVMSALPYPRYYLDFETITLAVPRWAETRPYVTQVNGWLKALLNKAEPKSNWHTEGCFLNWMMASKLPEDPQEGKGADS